MSLPERLSGAQAPALVRYFPAISRLPASGGIVAKAPVGALSGDAGCRSASLALLPPMRG